MDISNYSGALTIEAVEGWKREGIEKVIVGTQNVEITRQQLSICAVCEMPTEAYVYMERLPDPRWQVRLARNRIQGFDIGRLWVDLEYEGARPRSALWFITQAMQEAEQEGPTGIYSRYSWWQQIGDPHDFNRYLLWYAHYDNLAAFNDWSLGSFGGWAKPVMKQYAADVRLAGINVDMNYFEVV